MIIDDVGCHAVVFPSVLDAHLKIKHWCLTEQLSNISHSRDYACCLGSSQRSHWYNDAEFLTSCSKINPHIVGAHKHRIMYGCYSQMVYISRIS